MSDVGADEARDVIADAIRSHEFATAELERATEVRDRAIFEAAEAGLTRRQIAEASGLTVGRIQQIITSISERPPHLSARFWTRQG